MYGDNALPSLVMMTRNDALLFGVIKTVGTGIYIKLPFANCEAGGASRGSKTGSENLYVIYLGQPNEGESRYLRRAIEDSAPGLKVLSHATVFPDPEKPEISSCRRPELTIALFGWQAFWFKFGAITEKKICASQFQAQKIDEGYRFA
ncbi:hypothetical protein C8R43DRAFT_948630 [Mycena crocata]|nr:hypothetical protein C8R43DRAFT_948630 [Mycena crocata]